MATSKTKRTTKRKTTPANKRKTTTKRSTARKTSPKRKTTKRTSYTSVSGNGSTAHITGKFEGAISARGELHIASGANCKANVKAPTVRVDGAFEGDVNSNDFKINGSGSYRGNAKAKKARLDGAFEGNITSSKMEIGPSGKFKGDVTAERMTISDGASFHGTFKVGKAFTSNNNRRRAA